MKRILVLAVLCAVAPLAGAELYKYVDKNGKTVYSDQPPANVDSKELHVAPGPAPSGKSYLDRDKELEKGRQEAREKDKKADKKAEEAKVAAERCNIARTNYRTYADGGRIAKYNDKGEREFLSDDEIEAGRAKSKREMDEACAAK